MIENKILPLEEYVYNFQKEFYSLSLDTQVLGVSFDRYGQPYLEKNIYSTPSNYLEYCDYFESTDREIIISSDFLLTINLGDKRNKRFEHPSYSIIDGEYPFWIRFENEDLIDKLFGTCSYEIVVSILKKLSLFELNYKEYLDDFKAMYSNSSIFREDVDVLLFKKTI